MYIPEWEIEEAIVEKRGLIELPGIVSDLKLLERQKYLKNSGRYIDLLFKSDSNYVIVELKNTKVDQKEVITNQVLDYRQCLSEELHIPVEDIICVLASPKGFSKDVKELCNQVGVITRELDEKEIISVLSSLRNGMTLPSFFEVTLNDTLSLQVLRRRGVKIDSDKLGGYYDLTTEEYKQIVSVKTWISNSIHDEFAKTEISRIFLELSKNAPIQAHEVKSNSNGQLVSNDDLWFWLFYSVMDRRSNAALFINGRKALENKDFFHPYEISEFIKTEGDLAAIAKIRKILEKSSFPLLADSNIGKDAFPRSIVDAVKLMSKYKFDFMELYKQHLESNCGNLEETFHSLWDEIQSVYGVGPRITSQFIRGMVLKGPWKLPLQDDQLLEKCRFNTRFAGPTRLALINNEDEYEEVLDNFANRFLDGNRAIISHVLWYIRKRWCGRKTLCYECPLAGYCRNFLRQNPKQLKQLRPRKRPIEKEKNAESILSNWT